MVHELGLLYLVATVEPDRSKVRGPRITGRAPRIMGLEGWVSEFI